MPTNVELGREMRSVEGRVDERLAAMEEDEVGDDPELELFQQSLRNREQLCQQWGHAMTTYDIQEIEFQFRECVGNRYAYSEQSLSVEKYHLEFCEWKQWMSILYGWEDPEEVVAGIFIRGLKKSIRSEIPLPFPTNLNVAYLEALSIELSLKVSSQNSTAKLVKGEAVKEDAQTGEVLENGVVKNGEDLGKANEFAELPMLKSSTKWNELVEDQNEHSASRVSMDEVLTLYKSLFFDNGHYVGRVVVNGLVNRFIFRIVEEIIWIIGCHNSCSLLIKFGNIILVYNTLDDWKMREIAECFVFVVDNRVEKKMELRSYAADSAGLMLSACCKHYIAYDLESWGSYSRYSFNDVDMEDTFQPPFRSCIHLGKASCLMCSYNSVSGIPACARGDLLWKAHNEWELGGYITLDCDVVTTVYEYQHYVNSFEDVVADVLKAGFDINCGTYMLQNTKSEIEKGEVQEEDMDRALSNLFSVQPRLGLYDGNPKIGRYGNLEANNVCTKEHKKFALEAARQEIVLPKNDRKLLPLNKSHLFSLAVIGPMDYVVYRLGGRYSGIPCKPMSLLKGIGAYVKESSYVAGCADVPCHSGDGFEEGVDRAKETDYVIIVVGLVSQEIEDHDRARLLLPCQQMALVSVVAAISKNPLILVLIGRGPVDVSFTQGNSQIGSIFWIDYPGEAGGTTLAEIIFGDYNLGGKLPITWYSKSVMRIPMNKMSMRSDLAHGYFSRTYRFYTVNRLYEFGEGMSYTNCNYKFVSARKQINLLEYNEARSGKFLLQQRFDNFDFVLIDELGTCDSLKFNVQVSVTNDGSMDGSHVLFLFATPLKVFNGTSEKQLVRFGRVHVSSSLVSEESILVDPCNPSCLLLVLKSLEQ